MSFRLGLAIRVFTGVFGANLNLGFAFSGDLIPRSQSLGANAVAATYPVWALVLSAGFISNFVYCSNLLSRQTWARFWRKGSSCEAALGTAMALLWLAGIVCYGGATLVGKCGTSLGFALFMADLMRLRPPRSMKIAEGSRNGLLETKDLLLFSEQ